MCGNRNHPEGNNPWEWARNKAIGHQKDIHDTTCISSGESMQEKQSIGIYYILKGKKCHHRNGCREFILTQIVREYGVGITVEVMA